MLVLKVDKKIVWPLRICFIVLSMVLVNVVIDIFSAGYVIGASGKQYWSGDVNFYLKALYYIVGSFLLIFLAVQTQDNKANQKESNDS